MKREEFTFDSRDGVTKIYAVRWLPDGEVKGVFQLIHGMAEHIDRYENVAEWFTQKGFVVTGDDHLGHGHTVVEGGTYGYFCKDDPATVVVRDVHRLKKITQEAYPGVPYFILGHSMGSFIMRNYMIKYGSGITGAIVCGTATQPMPVINFGIFLSKLQTLIFGGKHPGVFINRLSFGDPKKIPAGHENDWLCTDPEVCKKFGEDKLCGFLFTVNGFYTMFSLIHRMQLPANINKIPKNLPVRVIAGTDDSVGNYGKGVTAAYEAYKAAGLTDVELKLYEGLRHEILNEPVRFEIYQEIYDWMLQRIG